MIKNKQKKLGLLICFLIILFIFFFFPHTSKISATTTPALEVSYPTISGQTLTPTTKLPAFAKYLFELGMFIGFFSVFLSLTIAGVMYILSSANAEKRKDAADRVSGAISGLLILTLTYLIITTINPQLKVFGYTPLPENPPPPPITRAPGIYFYKTPASSCTGDGQMNTTGNVFDLGSDLRNKLGALQLVQDTGTTYFSILYNNPGLWGKCQYIKSTSGCLSGTFGWVTSASVHQYDDSSSGGSGNDVGVYFYHKPCFNNITSKNQATNITALINHCNTIGGSGTTTSGGYLKVSDSEIRGGGNSFYVKNLDDLNFTGDTAGGNCNVPTEQQNCIKYSDNGSCADIHQTNTLGGGTDPCSSSGDAASDSCTLGDGSAGKQGSNACRCCPALGGENISSIIINGNYLVVFIYFKNGDAEKGPWTSCQEFPLSGDINKFGPQQIKWEDIRNSSGAVPNYVMIIPLKN